MRWQMGRRSDNVEDRRGMAPTARAGGIGGLGLLVILGISLLMGVNPLNLIGLLNGGGVESPAPQAPTGPAPGRPGDFAQAYVIAHEVGHHVQNLLGIAEEVHGMRRRANPQQANALSVLMELQADCLAGVWAHHADRQRKILEPGDVEEGLRAAAAIGDDVMQRRGQGHVVPESWTHGSSAQRVQWFRQGLTAGRVDRCDTFKAAQR
jgi:predicted metalloprotease